jgi:Restriction endonuclease
VRQLLERFRAWRSVEAIGHAGSDRGSDIRAYEAVPGDADRLWLIQCKREQSSIGPSRVQVIVEEAIPAGAEVPYGFLFAAASDLSRNTRDRFKEELASRGVREIQLWGKAEIEDLLYLPSNRNILFTFFDIRPADHDRKQEAYLRWLQFAENFGTWAYEPDADAAKWRRELHDQKSAVDAVASPAVADTVQAYIDNLGLGMAAIERAIDGITDLNEQGWVAGAAFGQAMRPYRDRMVQAMREDTGVDY